jgi:hypothetical protein
MKNFIGVYDNIYTEKFCDEVIETYEWAKSMGFTQSRQELEKGMPMSAKKDDSLFAADFHLQHASGELAKGFTDIFWTEGFSPYAEEYSESLNESSDPYQLLTVKVQKTVPGEGYHRWHYEASGREVSNRLLTWILYLNDVEEGGETEFLYQHTRVSPKKGTLVIWPGAFTHLHRGNPPLSGSKYVLTGWIEI